MNKEDTPAREMCERIIDLAISIAREYGFVLYDANDTERLMLLVSDHATAKRRLSCFQSSFCDEME